ncbi:hypothetical protein V8F06_001797 [Rhypophila decipiens]
MNSIYSPGSPILLPHGARIFNRLAEFLRKQYVQYGFQEVITPTIYKKALWAKSGHLENYADDMYTVTSTSPSRVAEEELENNEQDEYGLKPMNCPGHCLIFAAKKHSYRELPIRYADFSPLHRNEVSGALTGLTRVRRFHQDDGHIFCRPSQIESEIRQTLDFIRVAYGVFRLGPYRLALSTRPEQYMGSLEDWEQAEESLRRALNMSGQEWTVKEGDGAFYGPKIDVIVKDADGKEHQTATIQLDFQLPKRFELEYTAPAPELEQRGKTTLDPDLLAVKGPVRPVLIHRAVLGSVERLMALLMEQYRGNWPFWLNPRQAILLTVNDTQPIVEFARKTQQILLGAKPGKNGTVQASNMFVDVDESPRSVNAKLREARQKGYGMIMVVGDREVETGTLTVDTRGIPEKQGQPRSPDQVHYTPEGMLEFMKLKNPPEYIAAARAHGIPLRQSAPVKRGPLPLELPILSYLKTKRVILASASPRRKALLAQVGLREGAPLEIIPSTAPEDVDKSTHGPEEYVSATARQKALHVYQLAIEEQEKVANAKSVKGVVPEDVGLVIAADTIIATRAGKILEKPRNEADHVRMLKHLRDTRVHRVLTSICVMAPKQDASHPGYEIANHTEETKVFFAQADDGLPDEVIESYVRTREGADKAGGYAIQGVGGLVLIDRIEGNVDNVVGLPVRKCLQLCEKVCFRQGEEEVGETDEEED